MLNNSVIYKTDKKVTSCLKQWITQRVTHPIKHLLSRMYKYINTIILFDKYKCNVLSLYYNVF